MEKTFEESGKTYHVSCEQDGDKYCCRIQEINQIYSAHEDEIEKKGISMVVIWNKHNNIWGMKNLRTKQFSFKPFGTSLCITLFTPYASKSWLWMWNRSKSIKAFTIRLLGINVYWSERNSKEKLERKIIKRNSL